MGGQEWQSDKISEDTNNTQRLITFWDLTNVQLLAVADLGLGHSVVAGDPGLGRQGGEQGGGQGGQGRAPAAALQLLNWGVRVVMAMI